MSKVIRASWVALSSVVFALLGLGVACSRTSLDDLVDAGPPPFLTSLSVSGATDSGADGGITLVPAFAPDIHDYYVRCASGTNSLTVTFAVSAGATGSLDAPVSTSSASRQTVSIPVTENEAIVAVAVNAAGSTEYWVRCLPSDFPELVWAPHPTAGTPPPGYYLVGNYAVARGESGYAMVLDSHGVPVWYTLAPFHYPAFNVDIRAPGVLSYLPGPAKLPYQVRDLADQSTTLVGLSVKVNEHELQMYPNGHYVAFGTTIDQGVDLTGVTVPLIDGGSEALGPNSNVYACDIVELDAAGNLVWQWTSLDHVDPVKEEVRPVLLPGEGPGGTDLIDSFHCNSIDIDPKNGNLLVSIRHMDTVLYIEHATGRVLWKLGGVPFNKDGAAYVPLAQADAFHGQHDARLRPGWESRCSGGTGQVTLFDDEVDGSLSRGIVYDVTVGEGDGGGSDCGLGATNATVAWQYKGSATSAIFGSFRILPDDSRVVGWGVGGAGPLTFSEVNVAGKDLLDVSLDPARNNTSYRAVKAPLDMFDLEVLRRTAGSP